MNESSSCSSANYVLIDLASHAQPVYSHGLSQLAVTMKSTLLPYVCFDLLIGGVIEFYLGYKIMAPSSKKWIQSVSRPEPENEQELLVLSWAVTVGTHNGYMLWGCGLTSVLVATTKVWIFSFPVAASISGLAPPSRRLSFCLASRHYAAILSSKLTLNSLAGKLIGWRAAGGEKCVRRS